MRTFVCCLLCLACSLPLHAEIYKIKDKDGNVTYTDSPELIDQPTESREVVDLKPINSQPAVEPQQNFAPASEEEQEEPVRYVIDMVAPQDESHVPPGQRDLEVAVQLEPQLQQGDRIQFIQDGKPLGSPSQNQSYVIKEIFRGTHTFSAQIINNRGQVLATTPSVTVYVHRPSRLTPP